MPIGQSPATSNSMDDCASRIDGAWPRHRAELSADEVLAASQSLPGELMQTQLSVPSAHCGGCIAAIENALMRLDGVVLARLNLSTRRATVKWRSGGSVPPFISALSEAGFEATLFSNVDAETDPEKERLVRATAVAGFGAMNIMLLSVSIWSGADDQTRDIFHFISALLALPVIFYSGSIFFESALSALRAGRSNMDVPISIGILLTAGLSLLETIRGEPDAYFDAVTSLIFFLLVGRLLDHMMRRRARTAVLGLARLMPRGVTVILPDGSSAYKKRDEIGRGDVVIVAPGDYVAFDGVVHSGAADIDAALVTGESVPVSVRPGSVLMAGMLNLNGSLELRVTQDSRNSFVESMIQLTEAAEQGRAGYRRLADRAASFYSPVVHTLAAAAFAAWFAATGDWHHSLTVAISVLIITCPCALGLAVPMVQVTAARRLFERGIALKDGSALERLAEVDLVAFDKTGTLTLGELQAKSVDVSDMDLQVACALGARSHHPVARAVAALRRDQSPLQLERFQEFPGQGVEAWIGEKQYRLGRPDWALAPGEPSPAPGAGSLTLLSKDEEPAGYFEFFDTFRPGAKETIRWLQRRGLEVEVLSGDRSEAVSDLASRLGVTSFQDELLPQDKVSRIDELSRQGRKVLMIGDGLNDGPALSAAHVSMAPSSAADVGRAAADLVFFGRSLTAVHEAVVTAAAARRLVRQNLLLAVMYNVIVVPVALAGLVTPLLAAIAMSLSSILVVANALRIAGPGSPKTPVEDFVVPEQRLVVA